MVHLKYEGIKQTRDRWNYSKLLQLCICTIYIFLCTLLEIKTDHLRNNYKHRRQMQIPSVMLIISLICLFYGVSLFLNDVTTVIHYTPQLLWHLNDVDRFLQHSTNNMFNLRYFLRDSRNNSHRIMREIPYIIQTIPYIIQKVWPIRARHTHTAPSGRRSFV